MGAGLGDEPNADMLFCLSTRRLFMIYDFHVPREMDVAVWICIYYYYQFRLFGLTQALHYSISLCIFMIYLGSLQRKVGVEGELSRYISPHLYSFDAECRIRDEVSCCTSHLYSPE